MEKNNILKLLVPLVAVVIIIESVLLVEGMVSGKGKQTTETKQEEIKNAAFDISFELAGGGLTVGQVGKINVLASAKTNKQVDNINVYVKYDPAKVEVSNLEFDKRLPKPTYQKVSDKRGVVVVNYYVTDSASGYKIKSGESLSLMNFEIRPKVAGVVDLEISTGNEMKESATMFVENTTGEAIPFSSSKLSINVAE